MDKEKQHSREADLDDVDGANAEETEIMERGRTAQRFIHDPLWPYLSNFIDEACEELNDELLHDPDTDQEVRWYSRLLWNKEKHYVFCQIRRKIIKVLRGLQKEPDRYILEAKNLLDTIRQRERASLLRR